MGDTTIKLLGLTKVSLRVHYWFLYDIIQIYIYTGVEKRFKATEEDQVRKKIKFLSLLKNENFFKALTLNLPEETILVFLSANYL